MVLFSPGIGVCRRDCERSNGARDLGECVVGEQASREGGEGGLKGLNVAG